MRELNTSYQNLKNQKKFLATSEFLYANKKPYQNQGMADTIANTKDLITKIEEARFEVNNYEVFWDVIEIIIALNLVKENELDLLDRMLDWDVNHEYFVKNFGAEVAGPNIIVIQNTKGSNPAFTKHKVWYDDDANIIKRELILP